MPASYLVRSAGPDHRFNTADDLSVYLEDQSGNLVSPLGQGGSLNIAIEHERGPFNGRAEVTGTVFDPSGAGFQEPRSRLRSLSTQADAHSAVPMPPASSISRPVRRPLSKPDISSPGFTIDHPRTHP